METTLQAILDALEKCVNELHEIAESIKALD